MRSVDGTTVGLVGGLSSSNSSNAIGIQSSTVRRTKARSRSIGLTALSWGDFPRAMPSAKSSRTAYRPGCVKPMPSWCRKPGSIDGKMRIEAAQPLDDYPLFILATQSEDAALGGWRRTAEIAAVETVGGILVVLIAGYGIGGGGRNISTACRRKPASTAELARPRPRLRLRSHGRASSRRRGSTPRLSICRTACLMFDAQERLVVFNRRCLEMHGFRRRGHSQAAI